MQDSHPFNQAANLGLMREQLANLERPRLEKSIPRTPVGHGGVDFCLKGGLRHGVLHEVFCPAGHEAAATGFVAGLAARLCKARPLLWIRHDYSVREFGGLSPMGMLELGLDPARVILLGVANAADGLRAAGDALSCSALGAVVIEIPGHAKAFDLLASRRLALAAAQKNVTPVLLRFAAAPQASAAETRWLVRASPSFIRAEWGGPAFEVELLRHRQGNTGRWGMEWDCHGRIFQGTAKGHGAVVSAAAN